MMSKKDYMEKQIIFVETFENQKLKIQNENIVLYNKDSNEVILKHSIHKINLIFICGDLSITSVLIKNCEKFNVPLIFLSYNLKPYCCISLENRGNFLLRRKQYFFENDLKLAKHIIENKIENQIMLLEDLRYKTKKEKEDIEKIKLVKNEIVNCEDSQKLLGVEGSASKIFFSTYFKNMNFKRRKPRTREDVINLLLDIGYHYLFNFIEANLEFYGFDVYYGIYHKLFYQRKSLVCDLMEPFRCIIDRRLKNMFNLKQIDLKNFNMEQNQFFIKREFNKKYTSIFLKEIIKYKEEIFIYVKEYYKNFINDKELSDYKKFKIIK